MNSTSARPVLACLAVLAGALLFLSAPSAAQDSHKGKVGLSAVVQNSQLEIMVPIWTSDTWMIAPSFGVNYKSDYQYDVVKGALLLRFNTRTGEAVPYLGVRVGFIYNEVYPDLSRTDLLLSPVLGGECFLKPNLSVGVEGQVNVVLEGDYTREYNEGSFTRYGNTLVTTNTAVMVTFYF